MFLGGVPDNGRCRPAGEDDEGSVEQAEVERDDRRRPIGPDAGECETGCTSGHDKRGHRMADSGREGDWNQIQGGNNEAEREKTVEDKDSDGHPANSDN